LFPPPYHHPLDTFLIFAVANHFDFDRRLLPPGCKSQPSSFHSPSTLKPGEFGPVRLQTPCPSTRSLDRWLSFANKVLPVLVAATKLPASIDARGPTHDLHPAQLNQISFSLPPAFDPQVYLMTETETYVSQRERSPRRRSRSPRSSRRRSYSPRSRTRSREDRHRSDRRSRSPISGGMSTGGGAPHRSFEERAQAREQMLSSLRESSQQDRRSVLHCKSLPSHYAHSQISKGLRWQS
jgi:hypothetical protein